MCMRACSHVRVAVCTSAHLHVPTLGVHICTDHPGEVESLGRVEKFFCVLQDVERLGPRLQAMQAKEQFMPQYETLSEEFKTILTAIEQVSESVRT